MSVAAFKTGHEIARLGFAALVAKLGPGGALQFILQYERGHGNYTKERRRIFRGKKLERLWDDMKP